MYPKYQMIQKLALLTLTIGLMNCGKQDLSRNHETGISEDSSASAAAAEAVGGALSGSNSNGTQASYKFELPEGKFSRWRREISPFPKAFAEVLCPTFLNTDSACSSSSGTMWLTYDNCSFLGRASWNGTQALTMSAGSASCGHFPNPGANQTLYRQFVQGGGSSSAGALTLTAGGYEGVVDDASADLNNFDNQSIAGINPNGKYGIAVHFGADGTRQSVDLGRHVYVNGVFDHSISGSVNVAELAGASSRTLNGSIKVYHNLLKVVGTSQFTNVVHENMCCVPTDGEITTTFSAGAHVSPTLLGQLLVGKSETLKFTGCGTATLTDANGKVKNVTLSRCF